jgi:hypothetical protein
MSGPSSAPIVDNKIDLRIIAQDPIKVIVERSGARTQPVQTKSVAAISHFSTSNLLDDGQEFAHSVIHGMSVRMNASNTRGRNSFYHDLGLVSNSLPGLSQDHGFVIV